MHQDVKDKADLMNPDVKAKWVTALRSGKYAQTRHSLNTGDSYCCLGVLCELATQENDVSVVVETFGAGPFRYKTYDGETTSLPASVLAWAGLYQSNPPTSVARNDRSGSFTLAELNDTGCSFSQIADIVERDL